MSNIVQSKVVEAIIIIIGTKYGENSLGPCRLTPHLPKMNNNKKKISIFSFAGLNSNGIYVY